VNKKLSLLKISLIRESENFEKNTDSEEFKVTKETDSTKNPKNNLF